MHQVYSNAQQVIIDVGEPSDPPLRWDPRAAFKLAKKLAKLEESHSDLDIQRLGTRYDSVWSYRWSYRRRLGLPDPDHKSYEALCVIFNLPWFKRMWVVQEASCAAIATIVCGRDEMSWHDFMRGIDFGFRSGLFAPVHPHTQVRNSLPRLVMDAAPRGNLATARHIYRLGQPRTAQSPSTDPTTMNLFHLMRRFHGSCAEDPRDKVFALLGLASLPSMVILRAALKVFDIRVDYRVEVNVLFKSLARSIFKASKCLDLLSIPSHRIDGPTGFPTGASSIIIEKASLILPP